MVLVWVGIAFLAFPTLYLYFMFHRIRDVLTEQLNMNNILINLAEVAQERIELLEAHNETLEKERES